jgi:hypothetical protein
LERVEHLAVDFLLSIGLPGEFPTPLGQLEARTLPANDPPSLVGSELASVYDRFLEDCFRF